MIYVTCKNCLIVYFKRLIYNSLIPKSKFSFTDHNRSRKTLVYNSLIPKSKFSFTDHNRSNKKNSENKKRFHTYIDIFLNK